MRTKAYFTSGGVAETNGALVTLVQLLVETRLHKQRNHRTWLMTDSPSLADTDLASVAVSISVSWLADSAAGVVSGTDYQLTTTTSAATSARFRVSNSAPSVTTNPFASTCDSYADSYAAVSARPSARNSTINSTTVTRSLPETEALFAAIKAAHPTRCFSLLPPPLPTSVSAPLALPVSRYASFSPGADASSLTAIRACIESIVADRVLFANKIVVRPFFFSVFKYVPPTSSSMFAATSSATSSPRPARLSSSPLSALALVFSKKPDDSDAFFSQVRKHVNALQSAAKNLCNRVDEYASKLIVLAFSMHELQLRLAEMAKFETNETVLKSVFKLNEMFFILGEN
ncbi:hypothetical protein HDU84_002562 [Entophlyctis sp. JEL0112]|nr:hypothetical protein HDU84_002562 [Entophlyctis sp. JEL0112]